MTIGTCKLCLKDGVALLKSHMMPAALYAGGKKELEVSTFSGIVKTRAQIKQPLLCRDCERRFNEGGEIHVLQMITPKSRKAFPLDDRMQVPYARDSDDSSSRFFGPEFSLEMDKFAYFAVSVVWRAATCQW